MSKEVLELKLLKLNITTPQAELASLLTEYTESRSRQSSKCRSFQNTDYFQSNILIFYGEFYGVAIEN